LISFAGFAFQNGSPLRMVAKKGERPFIPEWRADLILVTIL